MPESDEKARRRILVVDDDRVFCEILRNWLCKAYELDFAHDGEEALRCVKEARPDLVLLDIMMPKLSGFSVAWIFRNDPQYRGIPVIFMTAHAASMTDAKDKLSRADGHILKPFSLESLSAILEQHLPEALQDLGFGVPATTEGDKSDERRLGPRLEVDLAAKLAARGGERDARILSVSLLGVYVECDLELHRGGDVRLRFSVDDRDLDLVCTVAYGALRDGARGAGLAFEDLEADDQRSIERLLSGS